MKSYLEELRRVLDEGTLRENRTGIDAISLFDVTIRHNIQDGFPLLTTKKMFYRGIVEELLWMLRGETNIRALTSKGVHIWDAWADDKGELGPVYGKQWRDWNGIDQLDNLIKDLITNPLSRRHILTNWNVAELSQMALPPCHCLAQFYVSGNYIDMAVWQRSGDMFLGIPFDIASYATLATIIGFAINKAPRWLNYHIGDAHIYVNHTESVKLQLSRQPLPLPVLDFNTQIIVNGKIHPEVLSYSDFRLSNYVFHPQIKGEIAI